MKTAEEILKEICKKHAGGDKDFDKTWNKIFIEKKNPKPEELMFLDILEAMKGLEAKSTPQPTLPGEYYRAVPVSERLPELDGRYWVIYKNTPDSHTQKLSLLLSEGKFTSTFYDSDLITHWLEPIKIPSTREAASRGFDAGFKFGDWEKIIGGDNSEYPDKEQWLNEHYPE